ncbi:DUF4785 domain-containing protein [Kangiella sp. TOML190]|uniref:DUF4785 domain-containing protein n=1 Tax=Kangiella sp. TOML190 TaxID=2931351 RepID=UPI0020402185|nr:DUF4785 domain-containing protein [Kangiella sp. TOML190]
MNNIIKKAVLLSTSVAVSLGLGAYAGDRYYTEREDLEVEFQKRDFNKPSASSKPAASIKQPQNFVNRNSVNQASAARGFVRENYLRDFEPRFDFDIPGLNFAQQKSVSFSFPVKANQVMDFSSKQAHAQSREFSMEVTGQELKRGINLKTSAPGALVRISSFDGVSAVEPDQLSLVVGGNGLNKIQFDRGSAFETLVDSQTMQKTGMGFQRGTTGFKIAKQMGKGQFQLKTQQNLASNARYKLNVFEKDSDTELHLTADKSAYLKNEVLSVNAKMWQQGKAHQLASIKGLLRSPAGQVLPVSFNKQGQAKLPLRMQRANRPGELWTLETQVEAMVNGQKILREARVAFAYSDKTAKLAMSKPNIIASGNRLHSSIPVRAFKDGRYEVRAVLYATNNKGVKVPAMVTHSASDLAAGYGLIQMNFDQALLAKSGLKAPFELRNLQLRDQRQMAVLELK